MNFNNAPHADGLCVSELLTATADGGDAAVHPAVMQVLQSMRDKLGLKVVFVSDVPDAAWLPMSMGLLPTTSDDVTCISTPIVLAGGNTYGTLSCFGLTGHGHQRRRNLDALRMGALLLARMIDS